MVTIQSTILALIICQAVSVHTEALQDATEDEKMCEFQKSYFKTARIERKKNPEVPSCQEVCAAEKNCIIWRDIEGTCNLTVFQVKTLKGDSDETSSAGIPNCHKISDNAMPCEAQEKNAKLRKTKTTKDHQACKTSCEESENGKCQMWEFSGNSKCTHFILREEEVSSSVTYGVRYCSSGILPDECTSGNYYELEDVGRSTYYSNHRTGYVMYCDKENWDGSNWPAGSTTSPGWRGDSKWYKMTGDGGTHIPVMKPTPEVGVCSTDLAGWLDGAHPTSKGDSVDNAKFCFRGTVEDCEYFTEGKITHCGDFYVYYLKEVPTCPSRYCASNDTM